MRVINFGSLNIDKVYDVDDFAKPGETISATAYSQFAGGKGLNQSLALARCGANTHHIGAVGQGGEELVNLLGEAGVNTEFIKTLPAQCGHAIIQVNSKGQNCIVVFGGANKLVQDNYIDECLTRFSPEDILLVQNETSSVAYAMKKAHEIGLKIAFNPSPITDELLGYPLEYVDYFIVNELEGKTLAASESNNESEILAAMAKRFPRADIVLTLGKLGAVYKTKTEVLRHGVYDVPVVDTTAAGDTFCGYIFACLAKGLNEKDALHYASVASSLAVSKKGAAPSIPAWQQVVSSFL